MPIPTLHPGTKMRPIGKCKACGMTVLGFAAVEEKGGVSSLWRTCDINPDDICDDFSFQFIPTSILEAEDRKRWDEEIKAMETYEEGD